MNFIIRPAGPEDAQALNAMRRMPGTFENILGIPSEPVENSRAFLSTLDGKIQHELVAVVRTAEGAELVAGAAGLTLSQRARTRHTAGFGIMVRTDYQGMGLGRAIHLYESLGFEREGVRRKATIRGGRYADEYLMSRLRHTEGGL